MGQYKSRDAWDPTVMTGDTPKGGGDGEPYQLGDAVSTDRPTTSVARASPLPWIVTTAVVAGAGALAYFFYLPLHQTAKQQQADLDVARAESAELAGKVEELEKARAELEAAQAKLQMTVQEKEAALAELTSTQEELAQKLESEIAKGDVLIKQREGELVVDLVDKILFDSGAAELNEQGKAVLKKVGETFLKIPDKVIQIGGHTDNIPMSPKLVDRFPTNWELSAARATHVVRFLQDEVNVPGQRLVATGFSEFRPAASNRTASGRQKNRRIEVVLLPATGAKASAKK